MLLEGGRKSRRRSRSRRKSSRRRRSRRRSKGWARKASRSIERRGTEGVFTRKTKAYNKKHGTHFTVMKFACHVRKTNDRDDDEGRRRTFDDKTMDQANFALNINSKKCK